MPALCDPPGRMARLGNLALRDSATFIIPVTFTHTDATASHGFVFSFLSLQKTAHDVEARDFI